MEDNLVTYMTKLHHMADYLARGNVLLSVNENMAIEIIDDELVKQRNAFSVQEYNIYDILETVTLGEQKSIGLLIECIEDGAYEDQIQGEVDFSQKYIPDEANKESYDRIMKRVRAIIKQMALSLTFGTHIPLKNFEFNSLKRDYLDEEELAYYEDEKIGNLMYDAKKDCFCVINPKGEVIIESIKFEEGMWFYSEFLIDLEQDILCRKVLEKLEVEEKKRRIEEQTQGTTRQENETQKGDKAKTEEKTSEKERQEER